MKFGEHLAVHITPEWSSQYIEYQYMKVILEQAVVEAPDKMDNDNNMLRSQFFRDVDISFFQLCEKEAAKINTFFSEKLAESSRRFEALKDELQYIVSDAHSGSNRRVSIVFDRGLNTNMKNDNYPKNLKDSIAQRTWRTSLSSLVPIRLAKRTPEWHSEHTHYKSLNNLKTAFSEFYLMLVLLQNYQVLNFTGFRKILKKHDKVFQTERGSVWRKIHVDTATFHTSTKVAELIRDIENIFTDAFESGNRVEAMKRLRVPPLDEKNSPMVTFRFGLFVGMICLLLPALFAFGTQLNVSQSNKTLAWRQGILLYRSTCLIIIQIIFSGINVYGWSSSGVNHILIFEIDPRHHLTYQRILEIGTSLLVLWFIGFIGFILASYYDCYPFIQPLIFVALMILFVFNPIPIFYREARFWLLRKLARVFSSPFHSVGFTDFWLGDQLTSLELVFFDLESFFCFYCSNSTWWSTDLTSPASHQGFFCTGWSEILLQSIFLMLPSWFRFAQCLRRYRDTKQAFPHLTNAGKYATGFFIIITNSLRRATTKTYAANQADNPFLYLWIIAAIIGSVYKLIWDLKMDWGFFDKKVGTNKYLREQLVYSSKIYYYAAIIEDIIFRFVWTINIFIAFNVQSAEYTDLIGFCFGIVEIFRRFIWNFFRLENEHLNNCGQFRAVRDISIVPMPADFNYKAIDSKLRKQPGIRTRNRITPKETIIEEDNTSWTDVSTRDDTESRITHFVQDLTPMHDIVATDDNASRIHQQIEDIALEDDRLIVTQDETDPSNRIVEMSN
ncbi:unnamed protein product [Rotaria socialis]|uniref:Xenotropic and polytropic retrovirus receptor 1 n=1 Tax=Rotaria socialis TaxID=392032 RepID=A0A818VT71_9BILA|nr:unnamed protein product [Rotaria socialis]CAF4544179.1 unnamed protein product [Rotaria socialis]